MVREDQSSTPLRLLGTRTDVAQLEAINTTILKDGALVFVTAPGSIYALLRESTATADGLEIVQPIEGPGRWVRQSGDSGSGLLITDPDWYVDPVNGNDANDGLTPATALRTYQYGLSPRFNGGRFAQTTVVHQLNPVTLGDTYWALTSQAGTAYGQLYIVGEDAPVLETGVITAATAAATATRAQFAVAGADFTGMENKRVRITAGGDVDSVGWIQEVVSATTVIVSQPYDVVAESGTVQFQVGDTIVVEDLHIAPGITGYNSQRWADSGDISAISFDSLSFSAGVFPVLVTGPSTFWGCEVSVGLYLQISVNFFGCLLNPSFVGVFSVIGKGMAVNCSTNFEAVDVQVDEFTMDRCTNLRRINLVTGILLVSNYLQIWNWTTAELAALSLEPGTTVNASGVIAGTSAQANTYGVRVLSGGTFVYDAAAKPTVAGAAAFDVSIGGTQLLYAAVPAVNAANFALMAVRLP